MEKRVYTIEDAKKFAVTMFNMSMINSSMESNDIVTQFDNAFNAYGKPYEPPTPPATVAPPMCDEDKVWMAAVRLVNYNVFVKDSIELAFDMLDEFRRQQKEREGKQ